jgi:SAM-dependent methyltransferase
MSDAPAVDACPVCGNGSVHPVFSVDAQPANENVLYSTRDAALAARRGTIAIAFCDQCGFAFNQAFDPARLDYSEDYQYTQPASPRFNEFIEGVARELVGEYGIRNCSIVEIGCGKGAFLRLMCAVGSNTGIGFDTSYDGALHLPDERIHFHRSYFDRRAIDFTPDLITCRQVLEHVIEPAPFFDEIRQALPQDAHTVLYFEMPDFEWIVEHRSIWDFYYEHCAYYTATALRTVFQSNGFSVIREGKTFGGQYLRLDARRSPQLHLEPVRPPQKLVDNVSLFAEAAEQSLDRLVARIAELDALGEWAIWGAAAKGVTFSNLSPRVREASAFAIDINPLRQQRFLPLAGWEVVSPEVGARRSPHTVVVMNPIYLEEIRRQASEIGMDACVVVVDDLFT